MIPKSSVERVRAALLAAGHPDTITEFPAGTRTAADAAAAVGCSVAVKRADAGFVRDPTGFAIGGVAPGADIRQPG